MYLTRILHQEHVLFHTFSNTMCHNKLEKADYGAQKSNSGPLQQVITGLPTKPFTTLLTAGFYVINTRKN